MSETYVVKWCKPNKNGYGMVGLEGQDDFCEKAKYGFGTGKKEAPPYSKGDVIEATIGVNNGGWPTIEGIKVLNSGANAGQPNKQGSGSSGGGRNNDTQNQIMRQTAVKCAVENRTEVRDPIDVVREAEVYFEYFKSGIDSDVIGKLLVESGPDSLDGEDDIPY